MSRRVLPVGKADSFTCIALIMISNSRLTVAALLATAALSACELPTAGVTGNPVGVGSLTARTSGMTYTTRPEVTFYRVTGAVFVSTQGITDTCVQLPFGDSTAGAPSTTPRLSAGAYVAIKIGSRTDTLTRATGGTDPTYRTASVAGFPFTPGDSMVITVAGDPNGFPASTFRGRTAEPFVISPLIIPAAGAPIQVTWSPPGDVAAAMLISFQYAAGTSTTRNRQLACTFLDDGAASVSAVTASPWLTATNRTMTGQRVRTILSEVSVPRSYFNILSTFNWPTPVTP